MPMVFSMRFLGLQGPGLGAQDGTSQFGLVLDADAHLFGDLVHV